jgi:hypothetical protein
MAGRNQLKSENHLESLIWNMKGSGFYMYYFSTFKLYQQQDETGGRAVHRRLRSQARCGARPLTDRVGRNGSARPADVCHV